MSVEVDWYDGSRADLRELFELADDSPRQLDDYVERGRVLVARAGPDIVGHLQLVPTAEPGEVEVKNMAVVREHQSNGVGRALVDAAIRHCRAEGSVRMLVATAAAGVGVLRFYQRMGFRMLSVERDAFTAAAGYPAGLEVDGIPLLDRVWLALDLTIASPPASKHS